MPAIRYNRRRIFLACVALLVSYALLRNKSQNFKIEYDVENSSPIIVWEYVADFSNMKNLNPTMIDFNILSEHGNYDHWEYSAEYTEVLSSLPFITNHAHGDFVVKPDGKDFIIVSRHRTCFFMAPFCVRSQSEFRFSSGGREPGSTRCLENVTYECPAALTSVCLSEVQHQRMAIRDNLREHFASQFIQ